MIKKFFKITNLKYGVKLFKPTNFTDKRGVIWTSYKCEFFNHLNFNHDRYTLAVKNSLRGLHGDNKTWKLITCIVGKIFCVVVNFNRKKNFLKYQTFYLTEKNKHIILIPPKNLLGWCSLSSKSILSYKFSYKGKYIDDKDQTTVSWNDPRIKIKWPVKKPILSKRDIL